MSEGFKIDPWSNSNILDEDYQRLIKEFGIEEFDEIIRTKFNKHRFIRRKVIFGHRDLKLIAKAIDEDQPWAVMSGIKPSGPFHLGTLTTALEIIEFQKMGGKVYYCIADVESYEDNGIPFEKAEEDAIDNLADILASGLNPENAYVYRQSKEPLVKDVAIRVGRLVTMNMLRAIYGEKDFGLYLSALIQVGDIVLPQVMEGSQPTVVPVGIDQDPHLRLTRDLTRRYYKEKKKGGKVIQEEFFIPSATYHYLLPGLDGSEKMSKRDPNSYFTFNEPLESIEKKKLAADFTRCIKGELLCGEHKRECLEKVLNYVKAHRKKKEKFIDKAKELLDVE
ncbi:MAG: hypothetical protein P8Y97_21040 [Candidatus Lokiarchaeota archaeon]